MSDAHTLTVQRKTSRAPEGVSVRIISGPSAGQSALGTHVIVGRSVAADLVVHDPAVSEFHLELRSHPDGVLLQDLKSRNGTLLGNSRVNSLVLTESEELVIGHSLVRIAPCDAASPPSPEREAFGALRGTSQAARRLFGIMHRVAPTDLSVLLEGPTGTGKELAARGIHENSPRKNGRFQVVDCGAFPLGLAESLLFGHERGSFTGAAEARPGVFEAAAGGTVFLDEVGELPLDVQPKLLRVLEAREVMRIGSNAALPISVRVISATWRDLRQLVNEGRFRDDLYHRLAQMRVTLPALADSREDIPLLVTHFLRSIPDSVKCVRSISRDAMDVLSKQPFPGNVRELKNIVERAAQLADGGIIAPSDLTFDRLLERARDSTSVEVAEGVQDVGAFKEGKQTAIDDFECAYLKRLVARADGSLRRAALIAGVQRHHLRALLKKHDIPIGQGD
jgi:DNA-binding NtrC family response regulator